MLTFFSTIGAIRSAPHFQGLKTTYRAITPGSVLAGSDIVCTCAIEKNEDFLGNKNGKATENQPFCFPDNQLIILTFPIFRCI
jgi:hypothetical protein